MPHKINVKELLSLKLAENLSDLKPWLISGLFLAVIYSGIDINKKS